MGYLKSAQKFIMGPQRIGRVEYLWRQLLWPLTAAAILIGITFGGDALLPEYKILFQIFAYLPALYVLIVGNLSSTLARLHDLNKSGWWIIIAALLSVLFKPLILILSVILCIYPGTRLPNKYGEAPKWS